MAKFKLTAAEYAAMADMKPTDRQIYLDTVVWGRLYKAQCGKTRVRLYLHEELGLQNAYQAWRDDFIARPAESYIPAVQVAA